MQKNKMPVTFIIIALILGVAIFKQFDFETYKFENPLLAIIYIAVFIAAVYFIIKIIRNKPGK